MPIPTNANRSNLDQTQIFQRAFDESTDRLRVDADIFIDVINKINLFESTNGL